MGFLIKRGAAPLYHSLVTSLYIHCTHMQRFGKHGTQCCGGLQCIYMYDNVLTKMVPLCQVLMTFQLHVLLVSSLTQGLLKEV